ncbi:uncharacterized protein VTP21DRAFT_10346 [Calcarisporiella thermophila]|uniref:uncharacterized protein n=1 Tax=Calcarisporiella thermophila TaxID=911321 RepID=UPI0037441A36
MSSNNRSFKSIEEELAYYKQKAQQLAEALYETQQGLEEFQQSSRDLEEELERELEHRDKRCKDLASRLEGMRLEGEEWKAKYRESKREANLTINQLQREIDTLRQLHEKFKTRTRELELDNDDLERTERAAKCSLQDMETKYNKLMERCVILESEVEIKHQLGEQVQRLKDELRDTNLELALLKSKQQSSVSAEMPTERRRSTRLPKVSTSMNGLSRSMNSAVDSAESPRSPVPPLTPTQRLPTPSNGRRTPTNQIYGSRLPRSPSSTLISPPSISTRKSKNTVRMVQEMVGRVRNLEARLQSCRSLVTPLLDTHIPVAPNSTLYSRPTSPLRAGVSPCPSLQSSVSSTGSTMTSGSRKYRRSSGAVTRSFSGTGLS